MMYQLQQVFKLGYEGMIVFGEIFKKKENGFKKAAIAHIKVLPKQLPGETTMVNLAQDS
jgi:hypothetical protein